MPNLRGPTSGSGAQTRGLEAPGDGGRGPGRGLKRNDGRRSTKKVSARTVVGRVRFSQTSRLHPPCKRTMECGEDAQCRSCLLKPLESTDTGKTNNHLGVEIGSD